MRKNIAERSNIIGVIAEALDLMVVDIYNKFRSKQYF